jgi:uncharacterized protein YciW
MQNSSRDCTTLAQLITFNFQICISVAHIEMINEQALKFGDKKWQLLL